MKTLDEVKALLATCTRSELRDHAFGDAEVYWDMGDNQVAGGYFGGRGGSVGATDNSWHFRGADADALRLCGLTGTVERNDETGPDDYREGETLPALTLDAVRRELEGRK